MTYLIKNCHLISPDVEMHSAAIEIEGAQIIQIHPKGTSLPNTDQTIDAKGKMVLPGFIDMHTHGAMGADVEAGTRDAIATTANAKLHEGVTTLIPTTGASTAEELLKVAHAVTDYAANPEYCKIGGLHMEGPFLNPECAGAINPLHMRTPDIEEVRRVNAILPVRIVSVAVELEGALPLIKDLAQMGIRPSFAHSAATYEQFKEAHAAGMRHFTHFSNQMTPLHHREIGLVGAGLLNDDVLLEMICDRVHLCPEMIELVFKVKPIEQIALITDSILASWTGDGEFSVNGVPRYIKNGIVRMVGCDTLAGSMLKMNEALRNVYEITKLPLDQLVKTTSWNQAQSLGFKDLGKIESGYQADLVILNDDFLPVTAFVDGKPLQLNEPPTAPRLV